MQRPVRLALLILVLVGMAIPLRANAGDEEVATILESIQVQADWTRADVRRAAEYYADSAAVYRFDGNRTVRWLDGRDDVRANYVSALKAADARPAGVPYMQVRTVDILGRERAVALTRYTQVPDAERCPCQAVDTAREWWAQWILVLTDDGWRVIKKVVLPPPPIVGQSGITLCYECERYEYYGDSFCIHVYSGYLCSCRCAVCRECDYCE